MSLEISVSATKKRIDQNDDFILIDVRRADELEICKLEEARHIEMSLIQDHFEDLDKTKDYIIMCRSGKRSMTVTKLMLAEGFHSVQNMQGGILAWADEIDSSLRKY